MSPEEEIELERRDRREEVERRQDWHQTKGLSVTIIVLLITNIISTVWWAATLTNDVESIKGKPNLVERVIRLEAVTEAHTEYLDRLSEVLNKVDSNMTRIDRDQARTAVILDRIDIDLNKK